MWIFVCISLNYVNNNQDAKAVEEAAAPESPAARIAEPVEEAAAPPAPLIAAAPPAPLIAAAPPAPLIAAAPPAPLIAVSPSLVKYETDESPVSSLALSHFSSGPSWSERLVAFMEHVTREEEEASVKQKHPTGAAEGVAEVGTTVTASTAIITASTAVISTTAEIGRAHV